MRDQVYNMGMRTGTKIFDKGKDIGKKGLMTGLKLISKTAVGGKHQDNEEAEDANGKDISTTQTDFKWV